MKTHSLSSVLVLGSLALAAVSPAFANDALDIFKRMDANSDGRITATEHSQFAYTAFQASDTDRDGRVSLAECIAVQDNSNGVKLDRQATEAQMGLLDTDGDGQLSLAENYTYAKDEFQRADHNADGSLSVAEVQAAHNAALNVK